MRKLGHSHICKENMYLKALDVSRNENSGKMKYFLDINPVQG